jgi:hypothetical protein
VGGLHLNLIGFHAGSDRMQMTERRKVDVGCSPPTRLNCETMLFRECRSLLHSEGEVDGFPGICFCFSSLVKYVRCRPNSAAALV